MGGRHECDRHHGRDRGGTTITVESTASGFEPNTITVSRPTEAPITSNDSLTHTFTLDDGSVSELITGGETVIVTLDVSETTRWVCNVDAQISTGPQSVTAAPTLRGPSPRA
jgi:plastocyanin